MFDSGMIGSGQIRRHLSRADGGQLDADQRSGRRLRPNRGARPRARKSRAIPAQGRCWAPRPPTVIWSGEIAAVPEISGATGQSRAAPAGPSGGALIAALGPDHHSVWRRDEKRPI